MLDFAKTVTSVKETRKEKIVRFYTKFIVNYRSKDLMIKGGDFYAVYNKNTGMWSTCEQDAIDAFDADLLEKSNKYVAKPGETVVVDWVWDADTKAIDRWHKFVKDQMRDNFVQLDQRIIFANTEVKREDYASKRLPYELKEGPIDAYEELISTLYDPEEREKIEWAIGAIITGDSKRIQKFEVLYGDKGTGKSTIFDKIITPLFDGYISVYDAKELTSASNAFGMESFKDGPLVSIQDDGDLSKIENNTKLNSIVSHARMEVNAKYTKIFTTQFNTFLFMGTNKPVKITDAKSGILRRLIDVHPSGRKIPYRKYHQLCNQIKFELGGIAWHCLQVYNELGEDYYEDYVPLRMMAATNDFYGFIEHNIDEYEKSDMVTLAEAWKQYDEYCTFANAYKMPYRIFRTELGNYFKEFKERMQINGKYVRSVYLGFRSEKFENPERKKPDKKGQESWLIFDKKTSIFDEMFASCPAQGCKEDGSPLRSWANVKGRLSEIDTGTLHWVKPPVNLICIDFDIKGLDGEKDLDANLKAASMWPKTYAEVSKSGKAIHLYYYYDGDVEKLSSIYAPYIEIKVFTGGSALRRMLTLCNGLAIATISSGLPLKEKGKVLDDNVIKDEKHLRACVLKALRKEIEPGYTSTCVNYIKMVTDRAFEANLVYDISDLRQAVLQFAMKSSNQADRCVNLVGEMHFEGKKRPEVLTEADIIYKFESRNKDGKLVFFDIEIYRPDEKTDNPGLFLICWKYENADTVNSMINPAPYEVEELFSMLLVGFNNRNYDNAMIWGASLGKTNQELYNLSQEIIVGNHNPYPGSADASYLDVYDMCTEKMGLKKWEIKLGITHKEMGIPWDEPAPKDRWNDIIEYCTNDVLATEAVFHARQGDFMARKIQVAIVELLHPGEGIKVCVNDTTNTLSKRIIFGRNKKPQSSFNYRDLSKPVGSDRYEEYRERFGDDYKFRVFNSEGLPMYRDYIPGEVLPDGWSILPFFPGYEFKRNEKGKWESTYLGDVIGEGGRTYSRKGYYEWVWDGDVSSMHPHSIIAECLFGPVYTKIFKDIVDGRVAVKHHDFATAGALLDGALGPYLSDEHAGDLAQALKIVINSIYGLTSAKFENEFRDHRNVDNIVAKRGALFMTLLKREVERRGAVVCHIKTDSIKIPNASDEVKDFVIKFGREFGYEFETEDVFTKFALFNDAAYLGYSENGKWVTKADQFKQEKQPFLFKTLFSHEPYEFRDYCETKSVSKGALYLDMNEDLGEPVDAEYEKALKKLERLMSKGDPNVGDWAKYCEKLKTDIPNHHNFVFIGRVGQFTPIKKGCGGGVLYRKDGDVLAAATGSKGYRWLESETVKEYGRMDDIDISYYQKKVDEARSVINEIIDVDYFVSDQVPEKNVLKTFGLPDDFMNIPEGVGDEIPF